MDALDRLSCVLQLALKALNGTGQVVSQMEACLDREHLEISQEVSRTIEWMFFRRFGPGPVQRSGQDGDNFGVLVARSLVFLELRD